MSIYPTQSNVIAVRQNSIHTMHTTMSFANETLYGQTEKYLVFQNNDRSDLKDQVPKYIIYVIEGSLLCTSNLLVFMTILTHTSLRMRKECIVVAGLAFADGMSGVAQFYAGVYRIFLVLQGKELVLVSRWDCLLKPHNLIWIWDETMQSLMLLIISIDRFFAVAFPLKHMVMTDVYAKRLVLGAYGFTAVQTIYGFYLTKPYTTPEVYQTCFTSSGLHTPFYEFYAAAMISYAFVSVLLYGAIFPIYIVKRKQAGAATNDSQIKNNMRQQRRFTFTLGISCVFTLFLNCIPTGVQLWASVNNWDATAIIPSTYIFYQLNPIINFVLYFSRHSDIRKAMLARMGLARSRLGLASRIEQGRPQQQNRMTVHRAQLRLSERIHRVPERDSLTKPFKTVSKTRVLPTIKQKSILFQSPQGAVQGGGVVVQVEGAK